MAVYLAPRDRSAYRATASRPKSLRYSLIGIADQLMELVERRLVIGGEAFVHDHYEDVLRLLRSPLK